MENKGNEFKGLAAGTSYKKWAAVFGFHQTKATKYVPKQVSR